MTDGRPPLEIEIARDDVRRRFAVRITGTFNFASAAAFVSTVRTGDLASYTMLVDLRDATIDFTSEEVRRLAEQVGRTLRQSGPRGAVALVTATPSDFGMLRMYQTHTEIEGTSAINVFQSIADAEAWLSGGGSAGA